MPARSLALGLLGLGALLALAGCGGSKLSDGQGERLNEANVAVREAGLHAGTALRSCVAAASTEAKVAECFDRQMASLEPPLAAAEEAYDEVLAGIDDAACRRALGGLRSAIQGMSKVVEQARRLIAEHRWEDLERLYEERQLDAAFDQRALGEACGVDVG